MKCIPRYTITSLFSRLKFELSFEMLVTSLALIAETWPQL